MKDVLVYLSGAISNVPENQAVEWRNNIENTLSRLDINGLKVFNPCNHFNELGLECGIYNDDDIMNAEIYNLRRSNVVFFNCDYPNSLGSMAEIAIAYDRRIPILAFNEGGKELHPWLKRMCTKIFDNREDLISYFLLHYL
jgi:hypothetical protein